MLYNVTWIFKFNLFFKKQQFRNFSSVSNVSSLSVTLIFLLNLFLFTSFPFSLPFRRLTFEDEMECGRNVKNEICLFPESGPPFHLIIWLKVWSRCHKQF